MSSRNYTEEQRTNITFTYDDEQYTLNIRNMAHMFNVSQDSISRRYYEGMDHQQISVEAAVMSANYPRKMKLIHGYLYR